MSLWYFRGPRKRIETDPVPQQAKQRLLPDASEAACTTILGCQYVVYGGADVYIVQYVRWQVPQGLASCFQQQPASKSTKAEHKGDRLPALFPSMQKCAASDHGGSVYLAGDPLLSTSTSPAANLQDQNVAQAAALSSVFLLPPVQPLGDSGRYLPAELHQPPPIITSTVPSWPPRQVHFLDTMNTFVRKSGLK